MRLEICAILRHQLGHDFSGYRSQTFLRRVERRMQVTNAATVADYIAKLRGSPEEVALLFRDLLIRVTSFSFVTRRPSKVSPRKSFRVSSREDGR